MIKKVPANRATQPDWSIGQFTKFSPKNIQSFARKRDRGRFESCEFDDHLDPLRWGGSWMGGAPASGLPSAPSARDARRRRCRHRLTGGRRHTRIHHRRRHQKSSRRVNAATVRNNGGAAGSSLTLRPATLARPTN